MKTKIRHVSDNALLGARALVAKLMPHLKWRHSGLGMLQAYVLEGPTDEPVVHAFADALPPEHPTVRAVLRDAQAALVNALHKVAP